MINANYQGKLHRYLKHFINKLMLIGMDFKLINAVSVIIAISTLQSRRKKIINLLKCSFQLDKQLSKVTF